MAFTRSNINEPNLGSGVQTKLNRAFGQFTLSTVTNDTFWLNNYVPAGVTITKLHAETASGTCDLTVNINGTPVTGITSVGASSTRVTATATAANTAATGDRLTLTIANNVDGVMLGITLEGVWS